MRKPIKSIQEFDEYHRKMDELLRQYRLTNRGRGCVDERMEEALELRSAAKLKAVNPVSRIEFTKTITRKVKRVFSKYKIPHFHFVTLISKDHGMRLRSADTHSFEKQKNWIADILGGQDYIGMLDVAYYLNAAFVPGLPEPWICWHAHLIAWNISDQDIAKLKDITNCKYEAFLPGAVAFHSRKLGASLIESRTTYVCKLPRDEYFTWELMKNVTDPASGLKRRVLTGKCRQNPRQIRTGHFAKALSVIGPEKTIGDLCVAGGRGRKVRKDTMRVARQRLREQQDDRDRQLNDALHDNLKK